MFRICCVALCCLFATAHTTYRRMKWATVNGSRWSNAITQPIEDATIYSVSVLLLSSEIRMQSVHTWNEHTGTDTRNNKKCMLRMRFVTAVTVLQQTHTQFQFFFLKWMAEGMWKSSIVNTRISCLCVCVWCESTRGGIRCSIHFSQSIFFWLICHAKLLPVIVLYSDCVENGQWSGASKLSASSTLLSSFCSCWCCSLSLPLLLCGPYAWAIVRDFAPVARFFASTSERCAKKEWRINERTNVKSIVSNSNTFFCCWLFREARPEARLSLVNSVVFFLNGMYVFSI